MLGRDLVIISKKMFWLKLKICIKNIRTLTDEKYRGKSLQWSYLNDVLFIANSIAFLQCMPPCCYVISSVSTVYRAEETKELPKSEEAITNIPEDTSVFLEALL